MYELDDQPLLTQCTARESGAYQCEAWLTAPDEPHAHFITDKTIEEALSR